MFLAEAESSGILGNRGSLMLDVVFIAMFLIPPILLVSKILAAKGYREIHRWIQTVVAIVLLVAVTAFEIDVRFFH